MGPVAVIVDSSAWGPYDSGVFTGCNNTDPILDHVVQAVGYGTDAASGLGILWFIILVCARILFGCFCVPLQWTMKKFISY